MNLRWIVLLSLLVPAGPVTAYDSWYPVTQVATRQNLWGVAYDGDDTILAVGEQGVIIGSTYSGAAWQRRTSSSTVWLTAVGHGNARWIAVGDLGTILTSDDSGFTWVARASGVTTRLNAVCHGNGRWLAVGEAGTVLTSADGALWTQRPALGPGFLRALAFGQGRFLLGGANGALFTTVDGTTFTPVPVATTANIEGAAISDSRFWVVGSEGLLATAKQLGTWSLAQAGATVVRAIVHKSSEEATTVGELSTEAVTVVNSAQTYESGRWTGSYPTPPFLATAVTAGKGESIAVGFGGGIAQGRLDSSPTIVVEASARSAIYGREVRLTAVVNGTTASAYQWMRGTSDLPGATQAELRVVPDGSTPSDSYTVRVMTPLGLRQANGITLSVVPGGRPEVIDRSFVSALPVMPSLVAVQPDEKLLVAGSFSVAPAGGATAGLARLNRDGSLDRGFRAGQGISPLSAIYAFHPLRDGRTYVRGNFTAIGGHSRPGLARLLADGTVDPAFAPDSSLGRFSSSALDSTERLFVTVATSVIRMGASGNAELSFSASGATLLGFDRAGRILLSRSVASTASPPILPAPFSDTSGPAPYRYSPEGSPDPGYTPNLFIGGQPVMVAGNDVVGIVSTSGRLGRAYRFQKVLEGGTLDAEYARRIPGSFYPSGWWRCFFRVDGGVWIANPLSNAPHANDTSSYDVDGVFEPGRYADTPDKAYYTILATSADGSLYVGSDRPFANAATVARETLLRILPITGRVGRLTNLSVRAVVGGSATPLIVGFVTSGSGTSRALVRAVGPSLRSFGVADPLPDPTLTLNRDAVAQAGNRGWDSGLAPGFDRVGAFPLPVGSSDAAIESAIGAGNYTAVVGTVSNSTGTALVELYDSTGDPPTARQFVNVSARNQIDVTHPIIVGFSISGEVPVTVLIRGLGPALTAFGVPAAMADPKLKLFRGASALWENDNWSDDPAFAEAIAAANTRAGAFPLVRGSKDAAMLATLAPGSYTAVLSMAAGVPAGVALVEAYVVP